MDPCCRFSQALEAIPLPSSSEEKKLVDRTLSLKHNFTSEQYQALLGLRKRICRIKAQIDSKKRDVLEFEGEIKQKKVEILELRALLESRLSYFGVIGNVSGGVKLSAWISAALIAAGAFTVTVLAPPVAAGATVGLGIIGVVGGSTKEAITSESETIKTYTPADLEEILHQDSLEIDENELGSNWKDKDQFEQMAGQLSKNNRTGPLSQHVASLVDLYDQYHSVKQQYSKIVSAANKALALFKEEWTVLDHCSKLTCPNEVTSKILDSIKEVPSNVKDALQMKKRTHKEAIDPETSVESADRKKSRTEKKTGASHQIESKEE